MHRKKIGLSIDVEDWFTVRNMRDFFDYSHWENAEQRLHHGLNFILDELKKKNIKATFFVLGWVADHHPELLKRIMKDGHEIASHGYSHTPIDLLTPNLFEEDLIKSLDAIYKVTGKKVIGYRAPSFSITKKTIWALEILKKHKIEYDSSIFSITHPDYGIKDFPTKLTQIKGIFEFPMKKGNFLGIKIPVCGGGYFRMLPYWLLKLVLKETLKKEPFLMYFHPWEFDPEQPKIPLSRFKKFRHYVGLKSNKKKFKQLLNDFEFTTIENLIQIEKNKGLNFIEGEPPSSVAQLINP